MPHCGYTRLQNLFALFVLTVAYNGGDGGRDRDRVDCDVRAGDQEVVTGVEGEGVKGGAREYSSGPVTHPTSY